MGNDQLRKLFSIIHKYFRILPGSELTIESNPEGLEHSKLALLKEEGVTRISLGVQSLNDRYLKYLGRNHDSSMAMKTFHRIREAGFDNVNVDLMFAFPNQTIDELERDVDAVLRLNSDHLSLYTLTVEEHSRFFAQGIQLQDGRDQAKQYALVCDRLDRAGFTQYEVSNFAKAGKVSQHNLHYWQGGEYIGLGIGAHSYVEAKRFWNVTRLNDYISRMQRNSSVEAGCEQLTPFDQLKEAVLFGLRMNEGIDLQRIEKRFGCSLRDDQQKKLAELVRGGFLAREKNYLKTSAKGRLVLDELCVQLI
jgi:oxygen-independent coproporphyrinogen-3 oxidase